MKRSEARLMVLVGYLAGQRYSGRENLRHPSEEEIDALIDELIKELREGYIGHAEEE